MTITLNSLAGRLLISISLSSFFIGFHFIFLFRTYYFAYFTYDCLCVLCRSSTTYDIGRVPLCGKCPVGPSCTIRPLPPPSLLGPHAPGVCPVWAVCARILWLGHDCYEHPISWSWRLAPSWLSARPSCNCCSCARVQGRSPVRWLWSSVSIVVGALVGFGPLALLGDTLVPPSRCWWVGCHFGGLLGPPDVGSSGIALETCWAAPWVWREDNVFDGCWGLPANNSFFLFLDEHIFLITFQKLFI